VETCYAWRLNVTTASRPTALRNYPMQAHGAEMLRIACCLATERGVRVCAPVHDALLIEAPIDLIDDAVITTRGAMAEAADAVLRPGVWIHTDVDVVRYPDRYSDPRGQIMWERVISLLSRTSSTSSTSSTSGTSKYFEYFEYFEYLGYFADLEYFGHLIDLIYLFPPCRPLILTTTVLLIRGKEILGTGPRTSRVRPEPCNVSANPYAC
jgi:hypothetical protein